MPKKIKDITLPKFLRLNKGSMWMDINETDSSGIILHRFTEVMACRGKLNESVITDDDLFYVEQPGPAKDKHSNKNMDEYGSVEVDTKKPSFYFDTTLIPRNKLKRILTAIESGVLVKYEPSNDKLEEQVLFKDKRDFNYVNGDKTFVGKNKNVYTILNTLDEEHLIKYISTAKRDVLLDMHAYEMDGYNKVNKTRMEIIRAIEVKLNDLGPGLGRLTINEDEPVEEARTERITKMQLAIEKEKKESIKRKKNK